MNALVVADRASEWRRLKALVLDSVSSPITRRVYNLGLDEFIAWFTEEPRPAGFTKATVTAWRVALEARKLGPISINVQITAVRKLAVEAADNGLFSGKKPLEVARVPSPALRLVACDDELIARAKSAQNGAKFERLWKRYLGGRLSLTKRSGVRALHSFGFLDWKRPDAHGCFVQALGPDTREMAAGGLPRYDAGERHRDHDRDMELQPTSATRKTSGAREL